MDGYQTNPSIGIKQKGEIKKEPSIYFKGSNNFANKPFVKLKEDWREYLRSKEKFYSK